MTVTRKEARDFLKGGGQRIRHQGRSVLHERSGVALNRQTGAGLDTRVSQILDARLDLTSAQRAVGNCFGGYFQQLQSGGGSEFLREYVDSTSKGGGGYSESLVDKSRMVACAISALKAAKKFSYPVGKARGDTVLGRHASISAEELAVAVCVYQRTLSEIAITNGWTRTKVVGGVSDIPKVPDRQRKALAEALRVALTVVDEAWEASGHKVPRQFMVVEVSRV